MQTLSTSLLRTEDGVALFFSFLFFPQMEETGKWPSFPVLNLTVGKRVDKDPLF